jgi:hypothetical protein
MKPLSIAKRRKVYLEAAIDYELGQNRFCGMCWYLSEALGGTEKLGMEAWGYHASHLFKEMDLFAFDKDTDDFHKHWSYEFHHTLGWEDVDIRATILLFCYYMTF